jgi:hypothetical protein
MLILHKSIEEKVLRFIVLRNLCTCFLLLMPITLFAEAERLWLQLLVKNEQQVFTLPSQMVELEDGEIKFLARDVSAYYVFEGQYLLRAMELPVFEYVDQGLLVDGYFQLLKATSLEDLLKQKPEQVDDKRDCTSIELRWQSSQLLESEPCVAGQDFQLEVYVWPATADEFNKQEKKNRKKSPSWWDIKPADDKAKKRMNKV